MVLDDEGVIVAAWVERKFLRGSHALDPLHPLPWSGWLMRVNDGDKLCQIPDSGDIMYLSV